MKLGMPYSLSAIEVFRKEQRPLSEALSHVFGCPYSDESEEVRYLDDTVVHVTTNRVFNVACYSTV